MTEPTRWSDSKAELDPVLRSVVRYGQGLGPGPEQLQRLLRVVTSRHAPVASRRGWRRFGVGVALGFVAAFGGVAWASYGAGWFGGPSPAASGAPPAPSAPVVQGRQLEAPAAVTAPTVVPLPAPNEPSAPVASAGNVSPLATAPPSSAADTELLQQARAVVGSDASRALSLTREHERRFPSSVLSEERRALRIEALVRLAQPGAASRELEAFERSYPRSPYRRRLRSLVSP